MPYLVVIELLCYFAGVKVPLLKYGLSGVPRVWLQSVTALLALFFVLCMALSGGCGRVSVDSRLAALDTLVSAEEYDSALTCLNELPPGDLPARERGRYYLLAGIIVEKVCPECNADSLLDICLSELGVRPDDALRARACYWKGTLCCDRGKTDEAYRWLKEAERLAGRGDSGQETLRLRHDALLLMCYLNNVSGNYNMAVDYGRRSLAVSEALRDSSRIGNDLLQLSGSYWYLEQPDSSDVYLRRLECMLGS